MLTDKSKVRKVKVERHKGTKTRQKGVAAATQTHTQDKDWSAGGDCSCTQAYKEGYTQVMVSP